MKTKTEYLLTKEEIMALVKKKYTLDVNNVSFCHKTKEFRFTKTEILKDLFGGNKCKTCGSRVNLTEFCYKGSGKFVCEYCKEKVEECKQR